jgi:hypothetical protein
MVTLSHQFRIGGTTQGILVGGEESGLQRSDALLLGIQTALKVPDVLPGAGMVLIFVVV